MEIVFGVILSLTAAVVGVWQISGRERDRPIHGPRDDGTLGLPHLQHWSERSRQPRFYSLRRNLPLLNMSRIAIVCGAIAVIVMLGFGVVALWGAWEARSRAQMSDELADIQRMHATAVALTDTTERFRALNEALTAANDLVAEQGAGDVDQPLLDTRMAIQTDIDNLAQVSRIQAIQPIGAVPQPDNGQRSRLIMGGGRLFLLADAFYQVDVTSRTLIKMLAPGDAVNGVEVGPLTGATWRDDGPLVTDADHAYVFDLTLGTWTVLDLGTPDQAATPPGAVAGIDTYDFNLYVLDKQSGLVLKYPGGDYASGAEQWSNSVAAPELKEAIDLLVTGSVYALMPDSRVIKLYLGEVEAVVEPSLIPPFDNAVAFGAGTSGQYIYVLNASDGRIARLDLDGNLLQQFVIDAPDVQLQGAMDIAVDESTGIAYILTPDGLYTLQLTSPPAGESPE